MKPRRPKSAQHRPASPKMSPAKAPARSKNKVAAPGSVLARTRQDELLALFEAEKAREADREVVLAEVADPAERQRLYTIFGIERQRAKEALLAKAQ